MTSLQHLTTLLTIHYHTGDPANLFVAWDVWQERGGDNPAAWWQANLCAMQHSLDLVTAALVGMWRCAERVGRMFTRSAESRRIRADMEHAYDEIVAAPYPEYAGIRIWEPVYKGVPTLRAGHDSNTDPRR